MEESASGYQFEEEVGDLASMDSGINDGQQLEAGQVGEIAEVEIGNPGHGAFSSYERFALGGIPDEYEDTDAAKVEGNLQDDTDADVASGTKVRLRLTDKNRSRTIESTKWISKSSIEETDPGKRTALKFEGINRAEWIKEGRIVVLEARNQRGTVTVATANSTFEFPFVGAF
jgi:hypothetical protein